MREFSSRIIKYGIKGFSQRWAPHSRLILVGDGAGWSLDWDIRELNQIAKSLGIKTQNSIWKHTNTKQAIYFASAHTISNDDSWISLPHRIGFSFPRGVPIDPIINPDPIIVAIRKYHQRIDRIQVSHTAMLNFVLETGIDPEKVSKIPIGINLSYFKFNDIELRNLLRKQLGIPDQAFVVGSFQKDGNGWQDGLEPKLMKGPDILVKTIERLKDTIPNLFVLLVGPSRGFVKKGLEDLKVPYLHIPQKPYQEVCLLYQTLDLYLVTSRQEGGPKSVLESLASGVPLVTTKVGQAMDLIKHQHNGWMVDVNDIDGLVNCVNFVYQHQGNEIEKVINNGLETAQANTYQSQIPLWHNFMKGFVNQRD